MKEIEEHGKQLTESNALLKKYDSDTKKDSPSFIKQNKKIFNALADKSRDKIFKWNKKIIMRI